ncbi:MAG: hypothetical protein ACRELB_20240 [Polyangiaceae bacterium]
MPAKSRTSPKRPRALAKRYGSKKYDGAHVKVKLGGRDTDATVIEDRGNVGAGGRHMLRIRVGEGDGAMEFEVPEEKVTSRPPQAKRRKAKTSRRAA